jgi:hypothetical protein
MAALTSADVVINRRWEVGDRAGKQIEVVVDATLTMSSNGATAADIASSLFAMSSLYSVECVSFVDGSSVRRWMPVFTDGTDIFTGTITTATDADRGKAENVTGSLRVLVHGKP